MASHIGLVTSSPRLRHSISFAKYRMATLQPHVRYDCSQAKREQFSREFRTIYPEGCWQCRLKRMAYVAVAGKMARVVYGIIKSGTEYRYFDEVAAPS